MKDKAHKINMTESNEKGAFSQLPLHKLSKFLKPIQVEECQNFSNWNLQADEIASLLIENPSGMIVINDGGATGGSIFLKFLSHNLATRKQSRHQAQIVRGMIAEPIHESGWLIPFIGQALSASNNGPVSAQDILSLATDLSERCGPLIIFLDGLNLVDKNVLFGDLIGLIRLFCDGHVSFQIIASLTEDLLPWCLNHELLRGQPVIHVPLPKATEKELLTFIQNRLQEAGLSAELFSQELNSAVKNSAGDIGLAIQQIQGSLLATHAGMQNISAKESSKSFVTKPNLTQRSGSKHPSKGVSKPQSLGRSALQELMSPVKKT